MLWSVLFFQVVSRCSPALGCFFVFANCVSMFWVVQIVFFGCCGLCKDVSIVSGCFGCFGPSLDVLVVLVVRFCVRMFLHCSCCFRVVLNCFGCWVVSVCAWLCEAVLI